MWPVSAYAYLGIAMGRTKSSFGSRRRTDMKALTLGALGLLCAGIASAPASAAPLGLGALSGLSEQQGVVEQVAWRKRWHNNNWGGNWHHRRHHHDNDNFG